MRHLPISASIATCSFTASFRRHNTLRSCQLAILTGTSLPITRPARHDHSPHPRAHTPTRPYTRTRRRRRTCTHARAYPCASTHARTRTCTRTRQHRTRARGKKLSLSCTARVTRVPSHKEHQSGRGRGGDAPPPGHEEGSAFGVGRRPSQRVSRHDFPARLGGSRSAPGGSLQGGGAHSPTQANTRAKSSYDQQAAQIAARFSRGAIGIC